MAWAGLLWVLKQTKELIKLIENVELNSDCTGAGQSRLEQDCCGLSRSWVLKSLKQTKELIENVELIQIENEPLKI